MNAQIDLFTKSAKLPQPPKCIHKSIGDIKHHDNTVMVFDENKGSAAPLVAYFFAGSMQGRGVELTQTSTGNIIDEYTTIKKFIH